MGDPNVVSDPILDEGTPASAVLREGVAGGDVKRGRFALVLCSIGLFTGE